MWRCSCVPVAAMSCRPPTPTCQRRPANARPADLIPANPCQPPANPCRLPTCRPPDLPTRGDGIAGWALGSQRLSSITAGSWARPSRYRGLSVRLKTGGGLLFRPARGGTGPGEPNHTSRCIPLDTIDGVTCGGSVTRGDGSDILV